MTRNANRLAWVFTAVVALALLALTVTLAQRQRTLPAAAAVAPSPAPPAADAAAPARPASDAPAENGLIAFVSDRDGNSEIYTMQPDGSGQTRLTDHPAEDRLPFWTLDGSRLAWLRVEATADAPPAWSLVAALPDGSDPQTVSAGQGWLTAAAESPAADQAAFYVVEDSDGDGKPGPADRHRLLLQDLARPEAQPVDLLEGLEGVAPGPNFVETPLAWTQDGTALYLFLQVDGQEGLYALPAAGGPPTLVSAGQVEQAALSPDGSKLALWRAFEDAGRERRRLFLLDLASGDETQFTFGGMGFQFISDLQWSRDGSRLAFSGFTGASAPDIYVLDVQLDQVESVSQRLQEPAFTPALSPDGELIVFAAQPFRAVGQSFEPAGDSNLYLVDSLGSDLVQVTADQGNNSDPVWQPVFR